MPSKLSPVTIVLRGVDKVTGTVNKISARMRALNKPVRDLSRAFSDLNRNSGFSKVMQKTQGVAASFAQLGRRALFAGTAIGVVAVTAMRKFISHADNLQDAANAAGVSVERLQEVRFAAGRAGIGEAQADKMMTRLSRTLGEVRLGTGQFYQILKKSNPELLKQFRAVQNTDEAMDLLMRTVRDIPNTGLRNALTAAALGRGGERLASLADSYDELIDKARELGIVLDRDTVARADDTNDAIEDLGHVVRGVAYIVGSTLLPVVQGLTQRLTVWINQHRELIRTKVPEYAARLGKQIEQLAAWLAVAVPKAVAFIEQIGGLKTVLAALAVVIMGPVLASLFALSAALVTTPFGWVVLGLSAIATTIALIVQNWDTLMAKFDAVPAWMRNLALVGLGPLGSALSLGGNLLDAGRGLFGGGQTDVGGQLDIRIHGAPASVMGLSANGPMDFNVGTSMSGAW